MKPTPPCYQCDKRRPGCHDPQECAAWADFEQAQAAFRAAKNSAWAEAEIAGNYVRHKRTQIKRRERHSRNRK